MNVFLFTSILGFVVICLTLPTFLKVYFNSLLLSSQLLYILTTIIAFVWYYFCYIKTISTYKEKEINTLITQNKLQGEKALLKQHLDIMENLISSDSLTGVWNKSYCFTRLDEEFRRISRNKGTFSAIMVDVDNFKTINDTYGHLVGDDYLISCAKLLSDNTRLSDVVCRYGGDEFFIILPDSTPQGAQIVAEKLLEKAKEIKLKEHDFSISVGLCNNCETFNDCESIINAADYALYQAKREGRNRIALYNHSQKQENLAKQGFEISDL
ncbi:MAG: GGDEF domain-containing protein [Clostridia bacterium]|nr:GGDEF domain-containing protein [Clostridia bacterium]MDD4047258.1 GGDEF domain-containing protein [Clostridia bacterium]